MKVYQADEPIQARLTEREERKVRNYFDYRQAHGETEIDLVHLNEYLRYVEHREEDIRAISLLISAGVSTMQSDRLLEWLMA